MRRIMQTVVAGLLVLASLTVTPLARPGTALAGEATVKACTDASFNAALSAVQDSGGGTITFGCTGVITFGPISKSITSDVTIVGNGSVILDGAGGQMFFVAEDAELSLTGLRLRNAQHFQPGGAIRNFGRLTVTASTLSGNSSTSGGGAILNMGTATVTASTFSGNAADGGGAIVNLGTLTVTTSAFIGNSSAASGGAIDNPGTLVISSSIFSGNSASDDGGAIGSATGAATITDSTFSGNSATRGGAIFHARDVTIATSTFSNNSAGSDGGAIYNLGATAIITDSTFSDNSAGSDGGAISNVGPLATKATITASTFSGNDASGTGGLGGAIHSIGTLSVTASTFSSNSASGPNGQGGAISNSGAATITANTFSGNSTAAFSGGGAIRNFAQLTLASSIMADSPNGFNCRDLNTPAIVSSGYNLSDDDSCNLAGSGDQEGGGVTTDLGDLQDNGGPTSTMLPGALSDAIDAADCAVSSAQDQRGATRPTASGPATAPRCDVGAVEVEGNVPPEPVDPPVQIYTVSDLVGAEGSPAAVSAIATGPDSENLSYAFDCNNDGNYESAGTVSGAVGTATIGTGMCVFSDDGSYTVGVRVCDGGDASNCDSDSTSLDVSNIAPLVDAGTDTGILIDTAMNRAGSFTDPGADTWTATVDYGDGSGVQPLALDGNSFTLEHVYTDGENDPYTVTVCVIDDDSGAGCDSFFVGVYSASELVGILADPITGAPISDEIKTPLLEMLAEIEASLEAGDIPTACYQWSAFSSYVESLAGDELPQEGVDNIVEIVDAIRAFLGCAEIFDPTITEVTSDGPVDEGSPATIAVTATGGSGPLAYAFDCDNDGSYETIGAGSQGQCAYADDGNYTVGVQVTDDAGGSATDSTTVIVTNVVPLVDAGDDGRVDAGALFSHPGSFTDPGADTWLATVDYGDGAGAQPLALAGTGFTLSHVYNDGENDPYTVTVCVLDDDGGEGCDSFAVEVLSAGDQIALLAGAIEGMGLQSGISKSLLSMLAEIDASVARGETTDACNQLHAFSNYVEAQAGNKLTQAQASQLLGAVGRIHATLGCG